MSWGVVLESLISRVPFERLLFPDRDKGKSLERLAQVLSSSPSAAPASPQKPPSPQRTTEYIALGDEATSEGLEGANDEDMTSAEDRIKGGTAGLVCAIEHVGDVASSDIAEALRMARSRGIKDHEVRKRLMRARQELNQLERDDLTPEKIVRSAEEEQELARWVLPKSAAMRHSINEILMRDRGIEDLEKLAAYANETAEELTNRVDALPPEQKATDECLEVKSLKSFLEERKLKKGA